ncbi:MAG TPA: alpha/beta hydrolase [Candidatus Kapabacteria bacterium]|jgi:acetyl esterase/lipase|nr:alpha/beta hydrolase [Candidatus Kapabacteria bacterium]
MSFFKYVPLVLLLNINLMFSQNIYSIDGIKPTLWENIAMYLDIQYDTIQGVNKNELSLDIYKNINNYGLLPVIVYYHGGGWNQGDKSLPLNLVKYFTDSGFVLVSANYRLSPDPYNIKDLNRVKFPIFTDDAARALKWTVDNIHKFNGDKSRIILMGFSAGGNIASTLALMPQFLDKYNINRKNIKVVVNLDGVALNLEKLIKSSSGAYKDMLLNAFGNTQQEWKAASPLLNIPNSLYIPPFFLATQTNIIRKNQFQDLADTLSKRGVEYYLYTNKYFLHNDFQQLIGVLDDPESKEYSEHIMRFIKFYTNNPIHIIR